MKNIAILYFLVIIVQVMSSKNFTEKYAIVKNKCADQLHLDQTQMEEIIKLPNIPEDNNDVSNFLNCVFNEMEFKNVDGSANVENIKSFELEKFEDLFIGIRIPLIWCLEQIMAECVMIHVNTEVDAVKMANCIKSHYKVYNDVMAINNATVVE